MKRKSFHFHPKPPCAERFEFVEPRMTVKPKEAKPYDRGRTERRHPRRAKGMEYNATIEPGQCCGGGNGGYCQC